jgi:hypothetical protein
VNNLAKSFVCLVCSVALFIIVVNGMEDSNKADPPKYREEAYTLEDGTRCTIVHGSSYAAIWSITCNYNKHRIGGES